MIQQHSHHTFLLRETISIVNKDFRNNFFHSDLHIKMIFTRSCQRLPVEPAVSWFETLSWLDPSSGGAVGGGEVGRKKNPAKSVVVLHKYIYLFFGSTLTMHSNQKVTMSSFPSSRGHCVNHTFPEKKTDTRQNNRKWCTKQRKTNPEEGFSIKGE